MQPRAVHTLYKVYNHRQTDRQTDRQADRDRDRDRVDSLHCTGFLRVLHPPGCSLHRLAPTRMDIIKVLDVSRNQRNALNGTVGTQSD